MDVVLLELFVHVGVVHAPHTGFVLYQRAVHDLVAVVLQAEGEADVGGAVQQHRVAGRRKAAKRCQHAAQHAVLVADARFRQAGDAVAGRMPPDDGSVVLLGGVEVAVGRVLRAPDDGGGNGGHGGEIHIRHPHGNDIEALFGRIRRKAGAKAIHGNGVFAVAVHDGSEIVLHGGADLSVKRCFHFNSVRAKGQATKKPPFQR